MTRNLIPIGAKLKGPAIIEDSTSTVIVLDGQTATMDKYGNIIICRR